MQSACRSVHIPKRLGKRRMDALALVRQMTSLRLATNLNDYAKSVPFPPVTVSPYTVALSSVPPFRAG
jgi:hypothetical protein